jgi:hypothetical protein
VCDLETSGIGAPYIYDISNIRVKSVIKVHELDYITTTQHVSGILMPIIRSLSTATASSGLPLERGGSSADNQQNCYHHVPTVNHRLLLQLIGS